MTLVIYSAPLTPLPLSACGHDAVRVSPSLCLITLSAVRLVTLKQLVLQAAMAAVTSRIQAKLGSCLLAEPQVVARPANVAFAQSTFLHGQSLSLRAAVAKPDTRHVFVTMAAYDPGEVDAGEVEEEEESEEDIRKAYEELYGKPFGVSSSKKSYVLAAEEESEEKPARRRRGGSSSEGEGSGDGRRGGREDRRGSDDMSERVLQVRRVTKVVKGGKQLAFRSVVVVGDRAGHVGVGVGKAKEVSTSVQKAVKDARRHMVTVPMTKYRTFPHRADGRFGSAQVMLRPAATGTGVIAGGAVRVVLELAGLENALGKELGSGNPLNNARAVLDAVSKMKQFKEVAQERGIPMETLWK